MKNKDYDFAGWVTKNDIRCSDGVVIKQNAFVDSNPKVPLVWAHDYSSPENVLGHMMLEHRPQGVYGYGYFNDTDNAEIAKQQVKHGDIGALSIGATRIKKRASDVVHGLIREVSLVLSGANPGATILEGISHSDDDTFEAVIHTGILLHAEDEGEEDYEEEQGDMGEENEEKTIQDVLDTFSEDQMKVLEIIVAQALEDQEAPEDDEEETEENEDEEGEDEGMKHNEFASQSAVLQHGEVVVGGSIVNGPAMIEEILKTAKSEHTTLKHAAELHFEGLESELKHAETNGTAGVDYGIKNIEVLFPEAKNTHAGIQEVRDPNKNTERILAKITKRPWARLKTVTANMDESTARAKGYIKGNKKYEDVYEVMTRSISPQTVYMKEKLDRDDIIDVTDYNIVQFLQNDMRIRLNEELVQAALIGDGRPNTDDQKIKEAHIKPIWSDNDFYTIKKTINSPAEVLEEVILALGDYRGSGTPDLYCSPKLAALLRLIKDANGRYLFGDIPTLQAIAARLGVNEIIPTTFLKDAQMIIVNLADYSFGSTAGGQVTTFEDFDIDFNQNKYLIETRLSGMLTQPLSAIAITLTTLEINNPAITVKGGATGGGE